MRRMTAVVCLCVLGVGVAGCHREGASGSSGPAGAKAGGDQKKGGEAKSGGAKGGDAKGGGDAEGGGGTDGGGAAGGSAQDKEGSAPTDTVKIVAGDQGKAGIRVAAVVVRSLPQTLTVASQITMDERHTEHIGAIADGRIERVLVLPGDAVRRGQTMATLHSHSVHETAAALTQAFAAASRGQSAVGFATAARDRYAKLFAIQAASLEEKQRAEQGLAQANKDLIDAEANVRAEQEHLGELLQVEPATLTPGTLYRRELIPVRAVADGVVITRSVTPGQVVNTGDETFVTSNLSTVWASAAVNERDVPKVRIGAKATVRLGEQAGDQAAGHGDGGGAGQAGTVTMLGDVVDPQTRTLPIRIAVANPGTRLRPGMFVTAAIAESDTRTAIFVPTSALQDVNGFPVVFVTADGTTFQARAVKTGPETQGMVEITEGLGATDHVVVDGAFMVKGELLKGTVGEG